MLNFGDLGGIKVCGFWCDGGSGGRGLTVASKSRLS